MKILFGVWGLSSGGAERVLSVLCSKLAQMGHEVHLYIRYHEEQEYALNPAVIVHRGYDCSIAELARRCSKVVTEEAATQVSGTPGRIERIKQRVEGTWMYCFPLKAALMFCRHIRRLRGHFYERMKRVMLRIPKVADAVWWRNERRAAMERQAMLAELIDLVQPDIIVPFLAGALLELYLARGRRKIPYVFTVRAYQTFYERPLRIMNDALARRATAIFVQTVLQKQYYSKALQKKTFVLGNPVMEQFLDAARPMPSQIRNFVAVGRLTKQKNYTLMIRSFAAIVRHYPDCTLHIYGDGEDKDDMLLLIRELSMQGKIVVHDRTANILPAYLAADAFVMTSDSEGMPNALMEAMCLGLACISTNCLTGPKELIGENERGWLVPIKNEPELIAAMENVIQNPKEAQRKATAAREYILTHHTPDRIAVRFIQQCEKIIKEA